MYRASGLTLILTIFAVHRGLALKCYNYNEVVDNPWERIAKNPDTFTVTCEDPLVHFEKIKEEPLTDEEKNIYASMKTVCVRSIRELDYSPDPKFYFGDCSYYKKGLHEPCKNMLKNSQSVKGMRVLHCNMCSTDNCNAGDPEMDEYDNYV